MKLFKVIEWTVSILLGKAFAYLCGLNLCLLTNSSNLVRPNWDNVQYDFPWLHEAKQMLGKLLLVNQKELEHVMIIVTDEWPKTVQYVGNVDVMYSLSH